MKVISIFYTARRENSIRPKVLLYHAVKELFPQYEDDKKLSGLMKFLEEKNIYCSFVIDEFDDSYRSVQGEFFDDVKDYTTQPDSRFLFYVTGSSRSLYTLITNQSANPNRTEELLKEYKALEEVGPINHTKLTPIYLFQEWNDGNLLEKLNVLKQKTLCNQDFTDMRFQNFIKFQCGNNLRSISRFLSGDSFFKVDQISLLK